MRSYWFSDFIRKLAFRYLTNKVKFGKFSWFQPITSPIVFLFGSFQWHWNEMTSIPALGSSGCCSRLRDQQNLSLHCFQWPFFFCTDSHNFTFVVLYLCAASRVEKTGIISQSRVLEKAECRRKGLAKLKVFHTWPTAFATHGRTPAATYPPTYRVFKMHPCNVSNERKGTDCSGNDTVTTGSRLRLSTPQGLRTSKQNTRFWET